MLEHHYFRTRSCASQGWRREGAILALLRHREGARGNGFTTFETLASRSLHCPAFDLSPSRSAWLPAVAIAYSWHIRPAHGHPGLDSPAAASCSPAAGAHSARSVHGLPALACARMGGS